MKTNHQCESCQKSFRTSYTLSRHLRTHSGQTIQCDDCPKSYTEKSSLERHKAKAHQVGGESREPGGEAPAVQPAEFVWEENTENIPAGWKIGRRISDQRRVFQVAGGSVLVGKVAVVEHMNRGDYSEGQIQSMMDLILNKLPSNSSLQAHDEMMFPEVVLIEADTEESSEKEQDVQEVLDVTDDVNEGAVDPPGLKCKTGIDSQTLRNTSRQLSKQANHCQYCKKAFNRSSNLKAHMKTIHSGVSVPCPYCDKYYTTSSNMRAHQKTVHDGEKFPCNFCTKTFIQKRGLVKHERSIHRGLKIKTVDKSRGKKNKSTQNRIKNNKKAKANCEICHQGFRYPYNLKRHIAQTHGDHKYSCEVCKKEFSNPTNVKRHKISVHKQSDWR